MEKEIATCTWTCHCSLTGSHPSGSACCASSRHHWGAAEGCRKVLLSQVLRVICESWREWKRNSGPAHAIAHAQPDSSRVAHPNFQPHSLSPNPAQGFHAPLLGRWDKVAARRPNPGLAKDRKVGGKSPRLGSSDLALGF